MTPPLLLLLTGLLYVLFFGGLSLLRREGLSVRFAVESVVITLVVVGLTYFADLQITPVVFLVVLYLLTLRVAPACRPGQHAGEAGQPGRSKQDLQGRAAYLARRRRAS